MWTRSPKILSAYGWHLYYLYALQASSKRSRSKNGIAVAFACLRWRDMGASCSDWLVWRPPPEISQSSNVLFSPLFQKTNDVSVCIGEASMHVLQVKHHFEQQILWSPVCSKLEPSWMILNLKTNPLHAVELVFTIKQESLHLIAALSSSFCLPQCWPLQWHKALSLAFGLMLLPWWLMEKRQWWWNQSCYRDKNLES